MKRRELFAAAGALAVSPLLPACSAAPTLLETLCAVPAHCEFAEVNGVVYKRIRYWMREGMIHDTWQAPLDFGAIGIVGTVSV